MAGPRPQMRCSLILFLFALLPSAAIAQSSAEPAKALTFEFASIRQNIDRQIRWRMSFTTNGVSAVDVTLQYVLEEAYGLYDSKRWSGGPGWLSERRFNIEARFDPAEYKDITLAKRRIMLQHLLADRFGLVVHHEPKELPVYALVVAKQRPKLVVRKTTDLNPKNIYGSSCLITRDSLNHVEMKDCTTHDFVSVLTPMVASDLGRNIVDETGLTGHNDFDLSWSPEDPAAAARLNSGAPTIFTALEKDLGLKLKPAKAMLDTIVIDRIEMPSQN
ncbi:MAG: TIGR03435 family protein [Acidobacteriaceae bacterium]